METPNNNLSILPFYDSLERQNHRKKYAFGQIFNLFSERNKLLPFQIKRTHSSNQPITALDLIAVDSGASQDILSQASQAGLQILEFQDLDYDLIINPSVLYFSSLNMSEGNHYVRMADSIGNVWFSEIFTVISDTASLLKLTYWDVDNFVHSDGHIHYGLGFRNFVFLPTDIGKPEYPFTEVAQQRDGHVFVEKQLSEKKYKFNFLAPEYLLDALRVVRMHDHIEITSLGQTYDVEALLISPEWQDQGDLASVEAEFECNTVIKKIGKSINPSAVLGDFGDDFGDDFNTNTE